VADAVLFLRRQLRHVPAKLRQVEDRIVAEAVCSALLMGYAALTDPMTEVLLTRGENQRDSSSKTARSFFLRDVSEERQYLPHLLRKRSILAEKPVGVDAGLPI